MVEICLEAWKSPKVVYHLVIGYSDPLGKAINVWSMNKFIFDFSHQRNLMFCGKIFDNFLWFHLLECHTFSFELTWINI